MRPINLIPADERRSSKAPVRTGPIAYLLIGALALGLGAVALLVLTNNKIADKKAQITDLQQREAAATAQAQQYLPFTNFATLQQSRQSTVKSLADSRFDWERVMRELSRVIPSNIWLVHLTGSAGGGASDSTTASTTADTSITGPSLQIVGCGADQDAVAGFLSALRDIDGVTRVGLLRSERPEETTSGGGDTTSSDSAAQAGSEECRTKDVIPQFEITVAFDNAPASADPGTTPAPTTPTTPPATAAPASSTTTTPTPTTQAPTEAPASSTTP